MEFDLTEEHVQLRQMVRDFAERELRPVAAKNDRDGTFPTEQIRKLGELGLMGITTPTEYGGAGMDPISYVIVMEEISRVCASTGVIISVNNSLACEVIKNFGTPEQKKKYLVPLASGQGLGAYCLTEPQSGSDAANQLTTAVRDGDFYLINGAKNFITNGPQSTTLIVFAMQDPSKGAKGTTAFIIETKTPGVEMGKEENKMGIRASGTCTITFNQVRIPVTNRLGQEGDGFKIAMATLDNGRIGIASQALGIAQACLEESVRYSKERKQFKKPLADFQGTRWKIADMAVQIDAARLLIYQAASMKAKGVRFSKQAAMAKLYASETASRAANTAVQIHGGYGYINDYPVERFLRDAKITEIYEGTSEIQRLVIASNLIKEQTA